MENSRNMIMDTQPGAGTSYRITILPTKYTKHVDSQDMKSLIKFDHSKCGNNPS